MGKLFTENGLQLLNQRRIPISNDIAKPWTDAMLLATDDILTNIIIPSCAQDGHSSSSTGEWRSMFNAMALECKQGQSITMDMLITVARKAT